MQLFAYNPVGKPDALVVWVGLLGVNPPPAVSFEILGQAVSAQLLAPGFEPLGDEVCDARGVPLNYRALFALPWPATGERFHITVRAANQQVTLTSRRPPVQLPDKATASFNLLLSSCYYQPNDKSRALADLVKAIKPAPDFTVLAGDQVYLDLPSQQDLPLNANALAKTLGKKYQLNWFSNSAQQPGLADVLRHGPVLCVPDDHEFWNNYPLPQAQLNNTYCPQDRANWQRLANCLYERYQRSPAQVNGFFRQDIAPLSMLFLDGRTQRDHLVRELQRLAKVTPEQARELLIDHLREEYGEEAQHLRRGLLDQVEQDIDDEARRTLLSAMQQHDIDYLPGSAELGDFDATSTTIALAPGGEQGKLPADLLYGTFERYWTEFVQRRDGKREWKDYTPYEWRNVAAFVRLGWRDRAWQATEFFFKDRSPQAWNQWAEVVSRTPRTPFFLGDLPHAWVASDFVRSALDMFAYTREADDSLVLAAGVPTGWLEGEGIAIDGLRTPYGVLGYALRKQGDEVVLDAKAGLKLPAGGLVLPWPYEAAPGETRINGKPASWKDGELRITTLPAKVRVARRAASVAVIEGLFMNCSLEGVSECLTSILKQIVCQLFERLVQRGVRPFRRALLLRCAINLRTETGVGAPSWCIVWRAGGDSGAAVRAC